MRKLFILKGYRQNKNIIRHQVLGDLLYFSVANKLPLHSYVTFKEIEELRSNHTKRRFAISYLMAKGDIQNLEPGLVKNIKLTDQGEKSYYSEHYKEIGNKQIANLWRNAINIILSIIVAAAAVIALNNNDNYKDELKAIPQIKQELNNVANHLDSIKKLLSPIRTTLDSVSNN